MKIQSVLVLTILSSLYSLNGSENTEQSVVQQYPFSDIDKKIFFCPSCIKGSPYSTASVLSFCEKTQVEIEREDYEKIIFHAKCRSSKEGVVLATLYEKLRHSTQHALDRSPQNEAERDLLFKAANTASTCSQRFSFLPPIAIGCGTVTLTHRNLAEILQWSNAITTYYETSTEGHTQEKSVVLSLGREILVTKALLKEFIKNARKHEQSQQSIDLTLRPHEPVSEQKLGCGECS